VHQWLLVPVTWRPRVWFGRVLGAAVHQVRRAVAARRSSTLRCLTCWRPPASAAPRAALPGCRSAPALLLRGGCTLARPCTPRAARLLCSAAAESKTSIQFIKGFPETAVPDVKLTRARDGSSGTASFFFAQPDVFEAGVAEQAGGDITGLYLSDEEGTLSTVDVNAKFVNGKPSGIEAKYTMKSAYEWDRFMRFMERYAEDNGACGLAGGNCANVRRWGFCGARATRHHTADSRAPGPPPRRFGLQQEWQRVAHA